MTGDERPRHSPLPVHNRPGLPALSRRIGTHPDVKAALLHGLSRPDLPALHELAGRDDGDFAVALLDATAVAVDMLTFYTERYAQEHYLRTATERRSLAELGRLVGYQVRPGLAATADLAIRMQDLPGAPAEVLIPAGTGVQSSPDPGGQPVIFETAEDLLARPAFNALRPRPRRPHPKPERTLSFAGTATNIRVGDGVLFDGDTDRFGVVTSVRLVDAVPGLPGRPGAPGRTEVELAPMPGAGVHDLVLKQQGATVRRGRFAFPAGITAEDLDAELFAQGIPIADVAGAHHADTVDPGTATVFRQQGPLFASQAPKGDTLTKAVLLEIPNPSAALRTEIGKLAVSWENTTVADFPGTDGKTVLLDGAQAAVTAGSVLVLRDGDTWGRYTAAKVAVESVAALGITGRATRVSVTTGTGLAGFGVRRALAYAQPEVLPLADVPADPVIGVSTIELDGLALGLRAGRRVIVSGEPADDPGNVRVHSTTLASVTHRLGADASTTITLSRFLPGPLIRSTVTIAANVTPAVQGQTRREPLGSGDATARFQRFTLRQPPLTYLSADTTSGMASTLSVWVGGIRWTEVPSLLDAGPGDRVYVVREEDGVPVVQFGDGVTGARLPTGAANVLAVYRCGSGLVGRVPAGRLTMPLSRPGGLADVTNPAPSAGGDDPETVDGARDNVPLRVRTLDRIVSLTDFADFARAFPGIAKASAVWARAAGQRGVLITIAGAGNARIASTDVIGTKLLAALRASGDPLVPVALAAHTPRPFRMAASVKTAADRDRAAVLADAEAAVRRDFGFIARGLGQPVAASEVLAVLHAVPGVEAATLTVLWKFVPGKSPGPVQDVLAAAQPAPGADLTARPDGAELLTLDTAPITWGVLS